MARPFPVPPPQLPAPSLWGLHQKTEAEWRSILATRPEEAAAWIRLAAQGGFKAAQLVLGQMHLDGHGVRRDPAAAYGWFVKAAAIGSLAARNMVGRCHELGWGVPIDQAQALVHYRKAADGGLDWGHYNVGCLLLYGTGVRRHHAGAFHSFAAAAALGHAKALGLLGRCHEEGWGTPVDRAAARDHYRRAAEGGDCWAALNLGLLLIEEGAMADAVLNLGLAIDLATPNCLAAIAHTLRQRPEPALAAVVATARSARAVAVQDAGGPPREAEGPRRPAQRPPAAGRVASWRLSTALLLGSVRSRAHRGRLRR